MKYFIIFSFSLFTFLGNAQDTETFKIEDSGITPSNKKYSDGTITISQDKNLRRAVNRHIELNDDKFMGWRVQIFFESGQRAMGAAQSVKKRFLIRYGNKYGAYIVYDSPYFKVQVGDFRTKAEALHFKRKISKSFPNSWVKNVRISYPVEITD